MKVETIKKEIAISAPRQKVWDVLFSDKYNRIWYAIFSEGSYAETDWKVGSKVVFKDKSGNGIAGHIIENKPYEFVSIEFNGIVLQGKEDYESTDAKNLKGSRENYMLDDKNGNTILSIESDMGESYFESMSLAWDKALLKVRELSEEK